MVMKNHGNVVLKLPVWARVGLIAVATFGGL